MHHTDLPYRREVHGISRPTFARLIGRSYQTVLRWENGELELPPWLQEWMEYMDGELICGRTPQKAPKKAKEIRAILAPAEVAAERARKRPRRTKAEVMAYRASTNEKRGVRLAMRKERTMDLEARKAKRAARRQLLENASIARATRRLPPRD